MIRLTTLTTTACTLALLVGTGAAARAQGPDTRDRTIMTFSGPAEMPGLTLQAGTYVFKLADTAQRNVVQVWDRNEQQVLGQFFFVPVERREATDETFVAFRETPEGTTPAIQYWYYPGQLRGREFIYPNAQATRIARATRQPVLTDEGGRIATIDAEGRRAERSLPPAPAESHTATAAGTTESRAPVNDQPTAAAQPDTTLARNTPPPAQVDTPSPAATTPAERQAPVSVGSPAPNRDVRDLAAPASPATELPQTASPMALIALTGLISAGAALLMRTARARRSVQR